MIIEHIKLKTCPFCGADPEYSEHVISCSNSNCTNVLFFGTTFEDVAEKWNNRQPTSAELIIRINATLEKLEEWRDFNQTKAGVSHSDHRSTHVGAVVALTKAIELLKNI